MSKRSLFVIQEEKEDEDKGQERKRVREEEEEQRNDGTHVVEINYNPFARDELPKTKFWVSSSDDSSTVCGASNDYLGSESISSRANSI